MLCGNGYCVFRDREPIDKASADVSIYSSQVKSLSHWLILIITNIKCVQTWGMQALNHVCMDGTCLCVRRNPRRMCHSRMGPLWLLLTISLTETQMNFPTTKTCRDKNSREEEAKGTAVKMNGLVLVGTLCNTIFIHPSIHRHSSTTSSQQPFQIPSCSLYRHTEAGLCNDA